MSRYDRIVTALRDALDPLHMEVLDESHMHSVPAGAESHFKLLVVSEQFVDQGLVARHRTLNHLLKAEFDNGLHALSMFTWTPQEWFDRNGLAPQSPPCLGGSKP